MKNYTESVNEITKIIDDATRLLSLVKEIIVNDCTTRDALGESVDWVLGVPIEDGEVFVGDIQFHHSHPKKASWSNVTSITLYMERDTETGVDIFPVYLSGEAAARLVRKLVSRMSKEA